MTYFEGVYIVLLKYYFNFLLVSGRYDGAHPDGHQHGVSIQSSIKLGRSFLSQYLAYENCTQMNLDEDICKSTSSHFPNSGLNQLNGFDFYF